MEKLQQYENEEELNIQEGNEKDDLSDKATQSKSLQRELLGMVSDDGRISNYQPVPVNFTHHQDAMAMSQYYEARMRDHAVAYASAAAGAAWAAAQIATSAHLPPSLPSPMFYSPPTQYAPHHMSLPQYYYYTDVPENSAPGTAKIMATVSNSDERPGKRHQRFPPEASREHQERRGRRRQRDYSSSSDTPAYRNYHKNKHSRRHPKKRRENLIGKTGISALHEWCVKRKQRPPNFVLLPASGYFCFAAYLDDLEWGRGQGATKGAAKQDAARKALQAIVPGVIFDANGLVLSTETADDDLLPNLAQRLAIDTSNPNTTLKKRRCDVVVYPSTATSSGEEDFYAGRNFSVCSVLLHAMWQINDQIIGAPSYSFEVAAEINSRPSSFACTGMLNLKVECTDTNQELDGLDELHIRNKPSAIASANPDSRTKTLTALGTGATKREARHAASAKLLAMLFPDCEDMVEVNAAAEATREAYAAAKRTMRKASDPNLPRCIIDSMILFIKENRYTYVSEIKAIQEDEVSVEFLSLSENKTELPLLEKSKKLEPSKTVGNSKDSLSREYRREQQLNELVDNALQNLNEFDVEERSLQHDVGKTILRRVEASDVESICRLLYGEENDNQQIEDISRKENCRKNEVPPSHHIFLKSTAKDFFQERFWGASSISLLLCRAVAPFHEPPLGCAILTFGFSIERGRFLRVAEIRSEPHLPQERFVECLQQFASNMKCDLDYAIEEPMKSFNSHLDDTMQPILLKSLQLNKIVESYFNIKDYNNREESRKTLQVVKEEDIEGDENEVEKEGQKKTQSVKDKHRKRSRVD
mmetsp:Transcript_36927/g.42119  ORF Transcript_36927/g.42119 Transcript_36927/m.42119 type:complete len:817 (-) Transcript_36927:591-3041(-)|eukprot:CAMPEP_0194175754 /NCGR_PEP_ID=MMETSP0154-20130528/9752_1 /TAXON_ID=1049557 /ORGANISM="Thalassiothrix antarctica, Strain L6-D1" /LENGTH=816 /DNA_ID=CAMNT_0038889673 /DNA_START=17 /DNA_END=2467 /DNA_ORIENTATION=-